MEQRRARNRQNLGVLGESLAAKFLNSRGLTIVARNVFVDGDELDLIVLDGNERIAVEVKTTSNGDDPMDAIDDMKRHRIRRATSSYGRSINRIDAVGVRLTASGVSIQWVKDVM
ncbi:MAG: YraN family protein [Actinomycetia bacterium]|nr:YraN family protein [Actinomycetes bacterium]